MSSTSFYGSQNLVGIGSVGIGTVSPQAPLHVNAAVGGAGITIGPTAPYTTSGGQFSLAVLNDGLTSGQYNAIQIGKSGYNSLFFTYNYTGTAATDYTGFTQYGSSAGTSLVVQGSGNVGIGVTNPASALDVAGGTITGTVGNTLWRIQPQYVGSSPYNSQVRITNGYDAIAGTGQANYAGVGINLNSYQGGSQVEFYTSSTNNAVPTQRMVIGSTGNVGIGTTNPGAPLVGISTATNPGNAGIAQFLAPNLTSGGYARICLGQRGGSDTATGSDGAYIDYTNYTSAGASKNTFSIGFTQGAADVFFVQSSGNVGIGTTNPAQMLHVTANAFINSTWLGASNTAGGTGCISLCQGFNMLDASNNYPYYGLGCSSITSAVNLQGYGGVYIGDSVNQGVLSVWNGGVGIGTYARYTQRGFSPPTNGLIVSGNVGIGTASPNALLDIYGANPTSRITNSTAVYGGGNSTLLFASQTAGLNDMAKIVGVDAAVGPSGIYQGRLDFYAQYNVGLRLGMSILGTSTSGCNVGIGLAGPSYQLDLSTDGARKLTTTTWLTGSDERIKTDIQSANLQVCYDIIKSIDLKYFKWNFPESSNVAVDDKHSLGFIAQEVKAVFPNAVSESNSYGYSDFLSLNTDQILKAMYGALKQTIADKEALEQSLATATANFSSLEARLAALEAK